MSWYPVPGGMNPETMECILSKGNQKTCYSGLASYLSGCLYGICFCWFLSAFSQSVHLLLPTPVCYP
ncbi:hypothetical protein RJ53_06110 [Methanocalculus chunghsingensis]|uniref:Uncharacterized protein n=1 Tax=Methanocalculus chunghsingensis TaxID=156457 RepID=A0A8J7W665_9EURY|nr:hypothetical protein [Methanocalculus chunghsingensis]